MINGTIDQLSHYLPDDIRNSVMNYVDSITKDAKEGYTYLLEDKVYGRIMSYNTLPLEECKIEAHDRYIDIQISIEGSEGIEVYQRSLLKEIGVYSAEKDVIFLDSLEEKPYAIINNIPGRFSMFFPEDAHRPKVCIEGAYGYVKKYVIKIEKTFLKQSEKLI